MPGALTWLWGQASRSRLHHCRCRCKLTGTGYHHMCGSSLSQYWVGYIMSTGSKNWWHDAMNDISADHSHPQVRWSLQLMTQDAGKPEQFQGDCERRLGFTTKSDGMWYFLIRR
jgi:hypothetical protein